MKIKNLSIYFLVIFFLGFLSSLKSQTVSLSPNDSIKIIETDIAKALSKSEQLIEKDSSALSLKYGALADNYAKKKDYPNAIKYYKEASSWITEPNKKAFFLKKFGIFQQKSKNYSAAMNAFIEIKDKYSMTSEARNIDMYIAGLQLMQD
jgi:tetratricopeptide (TPR) repeat protein